MPPRRLKSLTLAAASVLLAASVAAPAPAEGATRSVYSGARPGASGSSGNFGIGVMFGYPTGLTAKYWTSRDTAFDVGLSYAFGDYFAILGDYLWHFPGAFGGTRASSSLVPYVGAGAVFFFDTSDDFRFRYDRRFVRRGSELAFGVRVPLGLEFLPRTAPLGVFAELVPGVGLLPGVFGFFQGEIGIRIYV
jgi:hypothetical protein